MQAEFLLRNGMSACWKPDFESTVVMMRGPVVQYY